MQKHHVLITGLPGAGKTTLLVRLAHSLADLRPAGFYTEEMREKGERQGFRLVSLDGREGVLSHAAFRGPYRIGRYGVDVAGFEAFLEELDLEGASAPIVFIDEIGKMECLSPKFARLVREILASGKTLVATVALRGEGLVEEVKGRSDCWIVEVTRADRERLVEDISAWVRERLK